MATETGKGQCIRCSKEKRVVRCEGCRQLFCFDHLTDHRQELSVQLDGIEMNRDMFRQTLTEQLNNPEKYSIIKHSLIKKIDKWEDDSINKIHQTAEECRQILSEHTTKYINQIEVNLAKMTDQIRQIRRENDFNESDLRQFQEKLTELSKELDKPSNLSIGQDSATLIYKISVIVSSLAPTWQFAYNGHVPPNAVLGGYDDQCALYVGRFITPEGQLAPGKVIPTLSACYSGCCWNEHKSNTYEVLTHPSWKQMFKWIPVSNGNVPPKAVEGGTTSNTLCNDTLYVARGYVNGHLTLGNKCLIKEKLSYYVTRKLENLLQESSDTSVTTTANNDVMNINESVVLDDHDDIPSCSSTNSTLHDRNQIDERVIGENLLTATSTQVIIVNH